MEIKTVNLQSKKSKYKSNDPLVWILDEDLEISARYLNNEYLSKTIKNLVQILIDVRFYYAGIRNKRHYQYYFNKDNKDDTMIKLFPDVNGFTPKMTFYTHRTTKWARKCNEHYEYFRKYLNICFLESNMRFKKFHKLHDIILFLLEDDKLSKQIPYSNIKKISLDWKNIPRQYRCKDIMTMYRRYYVAQIGNPFEAYKDSKIDIPDFVIKANTSIA